MKPVKKKIEGFEVCCAEFAKQAELQVLAGGGFAYPAEMHPSTQIEQNKKTGLWNVNGCCGGGCYVIDGLKYCPWCGKEIATPPPKTLLEESPKLKGDIDEQS